MAKMNRGFITACALACACLASSVSAHSVRATMDAAGNTATFTGLARVTCFDDGSGPAAMLTARIRDNSPAVAGLLVNLQLVRGGAAISISDAISGDENYSDYVALPGGNGEYIMMVNKTAAGARSFDLEWHCVTGGSVHTGTDVTVQQFQ
ncbi:MAG: hypothetical protein SV422_11520 [Pseudomonadota bacterium]|nr:hypothetical protein [Pseudomonadota bacterium]